MPEELQRFLSGEISPLTAPDRVRGDEAAAAVVADQLALPLTLGCEAPRGLKLLLEGGGQRDDHCGEESSGRSLRTATRSTSGATAPKATPQVRWVNAVVST